MNIKNKILIIVASIIFISIIAFGAIFGLNYLNKNSQKTDTTNNASIEEQVKSKESLAQEASKNGDYEKAKQLFKEAIDQYKAVDDKNAEINASAQLYMIENMQESEIIKQTPSQSGN